MRSAGEVADGDPITFNVSVSGGNLDLTSLEYRWILDRGEITGGQGTPTIVVDTAGQGVAGSVTVTVEIGDLGPVCYRAASDTVTVLKRSPKETAEPDTAKEDTLPILGRRDDVWKRTATFDDSIVGVNTTAVSLGPGDAGRVRFRFKYEKPQTLSAGSKEKYKTELVIVKLKCKRGLWRIYQVHYLDARMNVIASRTSDPDAEWRDSASGFGGGSQYTGVGCVLIKDHGGAVSQPRR